MSTKKPEPRAGSDQANNPPPSGRPSHATEAEAKPYQPTFPIVGIGASAGGLEAVTQLLQATPPDTGLSFVLVQHLSPNRASMLPELLGRATRMPVTQALDQQAVQPDCVYVIPPGVDMCVSRGILELVPRQSVRGLHRPIDQFFRSLAEDQAHCAIGVILSGTASDGALGLEEIKAEGGLTFAQDHTAQQESMPRSAIATGCVDFVLPPSGIAEELARIARHPLTAPTGTEAGTGAADQRRLARIAQRLSNSSGVDFTGYKSSTLGRRVLRRMALHRIPELREYEAYLREHVGELDALFEDILIHVTRFFRDPEVFEALIADVLPLLFKGRTPQEPIRIWVPGCASGEEAYSLAIACAEVAEALGLRIPVQVFASDLSPRMIEAARTGAYSLNIAADVSPERLERFFTQENGCYHISRSIRDTCVFAPHNVLRDPPFSRMDLVSCRNMLIYLEPSLQQQVLPLLHYALKPGGILLLGKSETTGASRELFEEEDVRFRIYSRRSGGSGRLVGGRWLGTRRAERTDPGPLPGIGGAPAGAGELQREAYRLLAARHAPPGVLIDANLEILQFWGDTSPYLAPLPGKATLNVLRMARPGLLVALRSAIHQARNHEAVVRQDHLWVQFDGRPRTVSLEVSRVPGAASKSGGFVVLFAEDSPHEPSQKPTAAGPEAAPAQQGDETLERENLRLTQELEGLRDYLQAMIEQEQAVNEELQSAGEEAQSANEELQSINEELETSKEELQATNEELTTLNDELEARNAELHRVSSDWFNLLESVELPFVILGMDRRVRRYSPVAGEVLNLHPTDVGRMIGDLHLSSTVDVGALASRVIETHVPQERELQRHGRWYSLRVQPYLTLDRKVDGAALAFVDVDTLKRARQCAEAIVATVREPLLVLDHELRVQTASRSYYSLFKSTAQKTEGQPLRKLGQGQWDLPELRQLLQEVLQEDRVFEGFVVEQKLDADGVRTMRLNARRLPVEPGTPPQALLAMEDVTAHQALETMLERRVEELARADRAKDEFLAMLGHELRNPLAPVLFSNQILCKRVGGDPDLVRHCELIDRQVRKMGHLLEDLLEAGRVSRGMISLQRVPLDMSALIREALTTGAVAFQLRRQEITYSGPPESLWVEGDPVRLEQVVTNLLNNASKYTEPGGRIWVTLAGEADDVVLRVGDTGVGITPELLPRIFDLFTQSERSLDRSEGGLGIGLALVRSLTGMHGGTVEAHSEGLGRGSEFIVRLPRTLSTGAATAVASPPPEPLPPTGSLLRPRLLVVDDNQDSADTLAELCEDWGYAVRAVYDGPSAMETARVYRPQIVLLDIGLPGMDGYEVAQRLRRELELTKVRIVALTGYGSAEDRKRTQAAGFNHHLVKPVDPDELRRLLEAFTPGS